MPIATTATIAVYSSSRSQPMHQPTISPSTAYPYVYAEPARGIIPANSAYENAAAALAMPAMRNEKTTAGPTPLPSSAPLATLPAREKMPAPMIPPMPMAVSCHRPSARVRPSPSGRSVGDLVDGLAPEVSPGAGASLVGRHGGLFYSPNPLISSPKRR